MRVQLAKNRNLEVTGQSIKPNGSSNELTIMNNNFPTPTMWTAGDRLALSWYSSVVSSPYVIQRFTVTGEEQTKLQCEGLGRLKDENGRRCSERNPLIITRILKRRAELAEMVKDNPDVFKKDESSCASCAGCQIH